MHVDLTSLTHDEHVDAKHLNASSGFGHFVGAERNSPPAGTLEVMSSHTLSSLNLDRVTDFCWPATWRVPRYVNTAFRTTYQTLNCIMAPQLQYETHFPRIHLQILCDNTLVTLSRHLKTPACSACNSSVVALTLKHATCAHDMPGATMSCTPLQSSTGLAVHPRVSQLICTPSSFLDTSTSATTFYKTVRSPSTHLQISRCMILIRNFLPMSFVCR